MSEREDARVLALRLQFDRSFALRPTLDSQALVDLLAIRVAGVGYALRALEVSQLLAGPRVTPLPSPLPEIAGLCAVRGHVVPVYDLAALLGHPGSSAPHYVALLSSRERETIGFAFETLEAQLRVHESEIATPPDNADSPHRFALIAREGVRPIVQLAALLDAIQRRLRQEL
jgi:purine-binding chemotaxis protein CheW